MSAKTLTALEDALHAHYADEMNGGVLVSWAWITYGVSAAAVDRVGYRYGVSQMPPHERRGLLSMLTDATAGDVMNVDDNGEDL